MIIFLAAILDVPRHLYESAELDGAGRVAAAALGDAADDQPGDPVRGRARRDRRRCSTSRRRTSPRASPPGQASQAGSASTLELGYPEGSTLFYPILLYYHGFRFFNMGYASAMAMLLLVVAFAVTLIIIRNSRRWVHYQGAVAVSDAAAVTAPVVRRRRRRPCAGAAS